MLPAGILAAAVLAAAAAVMIVMAAVNAANLPADFTKVRPVSPSDHITGSPDAPVIIVEFGDLECPYCKDFHQTLRQIMREYAPRAAWVYRHYPIPPVHSKAPSEAQATECAASLGGNDVFWRYLDILFERTPSNNNLDPAALSEIAIELGLDAGRFNACLAGPDGRDIVKRQAEEALALGAFQVGTPFSIIVLRKPLSQDAMNVIQYLNAWFPGKLPLFEASADKKHILIRGAAPIDAMRQLFAKLTEDK